MAGLERADLVVISDVHLRGLDDERGRLFLEVLDKIRAAEVGRLVLLGDIFDFCLGTSSYFRQKFSRVGEVLGQIADSGTTVTFFEGNHEFRLAGFGWQGVEFVPFGDRIFEVADGTRIKAAHGDLVYSSWVYRSFRFVVKSWLFLTACRFVPGAWLERFALGNAEMSRQYDHYRKLDHEELLAAMNDWAPPSQCDHAVFGHFHTPYAETREQGSGQLLSVDCWDTPSILAYRRGQFWRGFPNSQGELVEAVPATSLLLGSQKR